MVYSKCILCERVTGPKATAWFQHLQVKGMTNWSEMSEFDCFDVLLHI